MGCLRCIRNIDYVFSKFNDGFFELVNIFMDTGVVNVYFKLCFRIRCKWYSAVEVVAVDGLKSVIDVFLKVYRCINSDPLGGFLELFPTCVVASFTCAVAFFYLRCSFFLLAL